MLSAFDIHQNEGLIHHFLAISRRRNEDVISRFPAAFSFSQGFPDVEIQPDASIGQTGICAGFSAFVVETIFLVTLRDQRTRIPAGAQLGFTVSSALLIVFGNSNRGTRAQAVVIGILAFNCARDKFLRI